MNIRFSVLGWLNLYYKIDAWDVEASSGYICGHEHAKLLLLKALKRHFTLILGDVAVHDLNVFLYFF